MALGARAFTYVYYSHTRVTYLSFMILVLQRCRSRGGPDEVYKNRKWNPRGVEFATAPELRAQTLRSSKRALLAIYDAAKTKANARKRYVKRLKKVPQQDLLMHVIDPRFLHMPRAKQIANSSSWKTYFTIQFPAAVPWPGVAWRGYEKPNTTIIN